MSPTETYGEEEEVERRLLALQGWDEGRDEGRDVQVAAGRRRSGHGLPAVGSREFSGAFQYRVLDRSLDELLFCNVLLLTHESGPQCTIHLIIPSKG